MKRHVLGNAQWMADVTLISSSRLTKWCWQKPRNRSRCLRSFIWENLKDSPVCPELRLLAGRDHSENPIYTSILFYMCLKIWTILWYLRDLGVQVHRSLKGATQPQNTKEKYDLVITVSAVAINKELDK
ncbi:hypothetical protein scyTo_0002971 [Scyliorhinus torazame]|uniref:Uncharacterized protein n=1 Tax=Scyliorhinus torazame TaxID=75743 RepID=A0A401PL91_SCYTO|nr:hypothetical protein [Scyliorhinus torazame]